MKLLTTSAGVKTTSIHDALVDLLGKPIAESSGLPTLRVDTEHGYDPTEQEIVNWLVEERMQVRSSGSTP